MAINQSEVSKLYVALFGRASEGSGNEYWQTQSSLTSAADSMLGTSAASDYFGASLDTNQAFIEFIYANTLNKTYEQDSNGVDYWTNKLEGDNALSRGEVVSDLIDAIDSYSPTGNNYDENDTFTVNAYEQFSNRVNMSDYTAETVLITPDDYATSLGFNEALNVTFNNDSLVSAFGDIESLISSTSYIDTYEEYYADDSTHSYLDDYGNFDFGNYDYESYFDDALDDFSFDSFYNDFEFSDFDYSDIVSESNEVLDEYNSYFDENGFSSSYEGNIDYDLEDYFGNDYDDYVSFFSDYEFDGNMDSIYQDFYGMSQSEFLDIYAYL